jgi:hypothetical protein
MKNKILLYISLLFIVTINSCKKLNPFEGVNLVVNNEFFKSPILIELTNANANSIILPSNVIFKLSGPGKDLLLDDIGGKNYKIIGNALSLVLTNGSSPSENNPVVFTLSVSAPGFLETAQTFTIVDTEPKKFEVKLVNLTEPPKGVACKEVVVPVSGGQITVESEKLKVAELKLETGTIVSDASGKAIDSKNLNAEVVVFNASEPESMAAFPGGFIQENVTLSNGNEQAVNFVTAGFVAVNMDANGKEIKNFSKPLEVKVAVSPSIVNPETGENLKEGTRIPTWSYETETGKWKQEGEAVVSKDLNGNLIATFYASHLSYWNLDFFYRLGPKCSNYYVDIITNSNTDTYQSGYKGELYDSKGIFISSTFFDVRNKSKSTIINPRRTNMKMVVKDKTGKTIGSTAVFDPCAVKNVPIDITVSSPLKSVETEINFSAICQNQSIVLKPSAWIYLLDPTGSTSQYFYMSAGKANIKVTEDLNYIVYMYYDNKLLGGNVKFNRNGSVAIPYGSDGIEATTSFNASKDIITYKAIYKVANCK